MKNMFFICGNLYNFFFFFAGFFLCCFKLKANVLPSSSFLLSHPHLCMFQLQSCENKSSFGFCYFKTAIGDVRVNTKSIKMLAECNAAAIQHDAGNGVESIKAFHIPRAHNCLRPWLWSLQRLLPPPRWRDLAATRLHWKKAEVSIQAEINHCAETIMCNSTIMKTGRDYGFVTWVTV